MIRQILLAVFFVGKFVCNTYASVSPYTSYGSDYICMNILRNRNICGNCSKWQRQKYLFPWQIYRRISTEVILQYQRMLNNSIFLNTPITNMLWLKTHSKVINEDLFIFLSALAYVYSKPTVLHRVRIV
jgi:hypothetical protein